MKGGGHFAVSDPVIVISTQVIFCRYLFSITCVVYVTQIVNIFHSIYLQSELVYCLAVVKSAELNIIGRECYIFELVYE